MSEQTKIPENHVVGVLGGSRAVEGAVDRLKREGFQDVLVMDRVDATGEGTNPLKGLIERLAGNLSDQTGYLDQYKEATESGSTVLAVGADKGEEAERARDILEMSGAVNIRYFGRLAVTDMTPETNPSAPSDELPQAPRDPERG